MRWVHKWTGGWIPHCRFSGRLIGSLAVPDKVQHRSWVYRDPDRQTWPQTGRGRWWWCMELSTWAQKWMQKICCDTYRKYVCWSEANFESLQRTLGLALRLKVKVQGYLGWSPGSCWCHRHRRCSESQRWTCWFCCRWVESAWSAFCSGWREQWIHFSPARNSGIEHKQLCIKITAPVCFPVNSGAVVWMPRFINISLVFATLNCIYVSVNMSLVCLNFK